METWKRKPKDHGLSTPQMMQLNGTKRPAKLLVLMYQNAVCMQCLQNKTFTKWADNQWRKFLIKLRARARIFSWLKWIKKSWPFKNKMQFNSHSDAQDQRTTELRIYSSKCPWFSTRPRESQVLISTSEFLNSFILKPITTVKAENHS